MNTHSRFAGAVMAASLFTPFLASALSVNQFEAETVKQKSKFMTDYIDKIVTEFDKTNPALGKAVHDYFFVRPAPDRLPQGMIAFAGDLGAVEKLGKEGKADLDKIQIEKIFLNIVKEEVVPLLTKDSKDRRK